jgi:beta-glucanase (GH16 family)
VDVTNHYWDSTKNRLVQDWRRLTLKKPNGKTYDLSDGLTVFGLEWTDTYMRIYVNNKLFQEITQHIPKHPMHLILGMGLGGAAGNPNRKTPFPSTYEVDYVRVYKKNTKP